tara:strand:- start:7 stop:315 length:309 start_codon:yes stop_codon:yes gene_type:complete
MKKFLIFFAYLCIYTTPIQIGFLFWIAWIIFSTDYTLLSLSTDEFLTENLLILKEFVFKYLSLLKPIYDFFWQFPAIIMIVIKTIISTWLGFWLLPIAKELN